MNPSSRRGRCDPVSRCRDVDFYRMSLARSLERRIESLVEGLGNKVFRGSLHPAEVAIRVIREAELGLVAAGVGPLAPNAFVVTLSRDDLGGDPGELTDRLNQVVEEAARERGWRLEGPPTVTLESGEDVAAGTMRVDSSIQKGELEPWGYLVETHGGRRLPMRHNREMIGRSRHADLLLGDPEVSRSHAVIWRDVGGTWIQDLASSNGTHVNGVPVIGTGPVHGGDVLTLGEARFSVRIS